MNKTHKCLFCDFTTTDLCKYKDHCSIHYKDPNLYLTCYFCNKNKPITGFRFLNTKCRLCVYLCRYRNGKTKNQYEEYLKHINANFHAVPQAT